MAENIERILLKLIATDRISIPIKSMAGKLDRQRPKIAKEVDLSDYDGNFEGDRVYARVEDEEGMKSKGMKWAIEEFSRKHPQYGRELAGLIAEQRACREPTLYFGMNPGCRLTSADYLEVMSDLGFSEGAAQGMYQELIGASRKISRARVDEERSILVG